MTLAIDTLRPGDACEVRFLARSYWMKAELLVNGGPGFWKARLTEEVHDELSGETFPVGHVVVGIYAEHVKVPGVDQWASAEEAGR